MRRCFLFIFILLVGMLVATTHAATPTPIKPAPTTALFLSDTHFDPFHDPGKVPALAAAPVSKWEKILSAPPTPTQAADLSALDQKCSARGGDTDYALFASTLAAIRQNAAQASFVTVTGDLLAHKFPCRFQAAVPKATPAQYEEFVEKTFAFQAAALRAALPRATFYIELGNNDSNCDDYKLDTGTPFLKNVAAIIGQAAGKVWSAAAATSFSDGGYYSVTMAAPIQNTRLIALDDIFMSANYATCSGKPDPAPAKRQLEWLRSQLSDARAQHQHVWVIGHIPTGVNPYSTLKNGRTAACVPTPNIKMFLSNDDLADTLATAQPDLVLFAHTHMDVLRLLVADDNPSATAPSAPVKLMPSISPVNGNLPAFTVALVDPTTAALVDYTVYAASDTRGTSWQREYSFDQTYGRTAFDAANVRALINDFRGDPFATTPHAQAYMHNFASGALGDELKPFWDDYTCALRNDHAINFIHCACDR